MPTLNKDNSITVQVNGAEKVLFLNSFRAMRKLGMKGPADGPGMEAALNQALQTWEGLVALLAAGGVDCSVDDLDGWKFEDMKTLTEMIPAAFGFESAVVEGEQGAPPSGSESKIGLSVVPLPDTISA